MREFEKIQTTRRDFEIERKLVFIVAKEFDLNLRDIVRFTRGPAYCVMARHTVAYMLYAVAGYSMTSAGCCIGRDRTAVRHAVQRVCLIRESKDVTFSDKIDNVEAAFAAILLEHGIALSA